jgi:hypothetical protein
MPHAHLSFSQLLASDKECFQFQSFMDIFENVIVVAF